MELYNYVFLSNSATRFKALAKNLKVGSGTAPNILHHISCGLEGPQTERKVLMEITNTTGTTKKDKAIAVLKTIGKVILAIPCIIVGIPLAIVLAVLTGIIAILDAIDKAISWLARHIYNAAPRCWDAAGLTVSLVITLVLAYVAVGCWSGTVDALDNLIYYARHGWWGDSVPQYVRSTALTFTLAGLFTGIVVTFAGAALLKSKRISEPRGGAVAVNLILAVAFNFMAYVAGMAFSVIGNHHHNSYVEDLSRDEFILVLFLFVIAAVITLAAGLFAFMVFGHALNLGKRIEKGDKESNSGESDHDIHVIVIGIPFGSEEDAENDETPSADNSAETYTEDENPAKDGAENPSGSEQSENAPETATPAPENSETATPTNNSQATSFPPVPPEPEEFSY